MEYPDTRAVVICFRAYEFPYENRPFRLLRSPGMYIRPTNTEQARIMADYTQALRNVVRLRHLYERGRENQIPLGTFSQKLNRVYEPALQRVSQLEKNLIGIIGSTAAVDPEIVLPFYSEAMPQYAWPSDMVWPNRAGVIPTRISANEFALETTPSTILRGTAFEHRNYFVYQHHLWSASLDDTQASWPIMVDSAIRPQKQQSNVARQSIPEAVRVYVWRRDEGKCTRCHSRSKLEYDHIIAVINGGSNTARNIELLCEACNRAKGSKVR